MLPLPKRARIPKVVSGAEREARERLRDWLGKPGEIGVSSGELPYVSMPAEENDTDEFGEGFELKAEDLPEEPRDTSPPAPIDAGAFVKNDTGKLRPSALPPEAFLEVVKVFTYGDLQYPNDNYRLGTTWKRYQDALERHHLKWWLGEDLDDESGLSHLAHMAATAMILLCMQLNGLGTDTRPKLNLKAPPSWKLPRVPEVKK